MFHTFNIKHCSQNKMTKTIWKYSHARNHMNNTAIIWYINIMYIVHRCSCINNSWCDISWITFFLLFTHHIDPLASCLSLLSYICIFSTDRSPIVSLLTDTVTYSSWINSCGRKKQSFKVLEWWSATMDGERVCWSHQSPSHICRS